MIEKLKIPIRSYGESTPVAPDTNAEVAKINELVDAVNAGLATSNAIVGGPKYVQYLSSQTYGVPADSSTLDRLASSTIIPGTEATVINPHPTPLTASAVSTYYRATIVPAGTTGAALVPAFIGSTDKVPVLWVEIVSNDTFTPLLTSELNLGKGAYAGLDLRPLLIALVNGIGTGSSTVITTPATTQPATGPTITGFLPDSATVGASVTLTGTGFTKATAVLFNGTPASFQVVNATTIVAVVPTGATTGPVAVTNSAGTATSAASFTVNALVIVTPPPATTTPDAPFPSFDPTTRTLTYQHALGSSELEINHLGGSYQPYAPVSVDDGIHNAGEWKARVKAITGRNASGSADSPAIVAKAMINQLPVANAGGDLTITLPTSSAQLMGTGTDADGRIVDQKWDQTIGPTPAALSTPTLLNTAVSGLVEGTYQFRLTVTDDRGGTDTSLVTITVKAQGAPRVTGFTPGSGPVGATVVLSGSGFLNATAVALNGVVVSTFSITSDTSLSATVPTNATTGRWSVTAAGGTGTSTGSFTVSAAGPANAAYVLGLQGQSNNLGVASISSIAGSPLADLTPSIQREFQRVKIWYNGAWAKLQLGVNNQAVQGCFGLEIGIAQRWEEENPIGVLHLIKYSRDGRPIEDWTKQTGGGYGGYEEYLTQYHQPALAALTNQGLTPVLVGQMWTQGESNAGDTTYANKLQALYNNWLADSILTPSVRLVVNKVRNDATVGGQGAIFVQNNPATRLVDTKDYATNSDNLHYNARAQFLMGYTDDYNALFGTQSAYPFPMTGGATTTPTVPTTTAAATPIEETDPKLYFSASWGVGSNPDDSGGSIRFLQNADGMVGATFSGTNFAIDFAGYQGIAVKLEVWVDGLLKGLISTSGASGLAERFGLSNLANGVHQVQLVCRAANFAYGWLDRLRCNGTFQAYSGSTTLPAAPTVVGAGDTEDNNPAWKYNPESAFGTASNGLESNAFTHYTTSPGAEAIIQFQGTGFTLSHAYYGGFYTLYDVYIDGAFAGTVEQASGGPNASFSLHYTSPTLAAGIHTVRLVNRNAMFVDLFSAIP